ncbi:hypothetical protein POVWA1_016510 [Plasmodium ovale wallikeri]|nr:hypothetical protein POVWA1_016510 [Plasmodium ovale wallikeri]
MCLFKCDETSITKNGNKKKKKKNGTNWEMAFKMGGMYIIQNGILQYGILKCDRKIPLGSTHPRWWFKVGTCTNVPFSPFPPPPPGAWKK